MAKANQFIRAPNPDGTKRDGLEHDEKHYRLLNKRLKVSRSDKTRNRSNVSRHNQLCNNGISRCGKECE